MGTTVIDVLKSDHADLIQVMEQLENKIAADNATDQGTEEIEGLFQRFKQLFSDHDEAEDKVLYPALRDFKETHKLVLKSYQAHHVVEVGIMELRLLPYGSENWGPKFLVVKDSILTHMTEEENNLFKKAEMLIDKAQLEALGQKVRELRD